MAFMGTVVTYGRGSMLVTQTGMATELGAIASMIQSVKPIQTPLQLRMSQLGRWLASLESACCVVGISSSCF